MEAGLDLLLHLAGISSGVRQVPNFIILICVQIIKCNASQGLLALPHLEAGLSGYSCRDGFCVILVCSYTFGPFATVSNHRYLVSKKFKLVD